ncbi:MAG: hypothetical protein IJX98_01490 [Clostridia bacterium]|nr:hypothetical protein [Clostridia bacterium]
MVKKGFKYFFIGVGICALTAFVVILSLAIMGDSINSALPIVIVDGLIGGIVGLIFGGRFGDWNDAYKDPLNRSDCWYKRISSNRSVRFLEIIFMLLPILLLGIGLAIILAINYSFFDRSIFELCTEYSIAVSKSSNPYDYQDLYSSYMGYRVLVGLISAASLFFLVYGVKFLFKYKKYQCKKCGSVMPWVYKNTLKSDYGTYTKSKEVETRGKVGTVYIDGQSVGEVYGRTGSYTKNYTTYSNSAFYLCECKFCRNEKVFQYRNSWTNITYS